MLNGATPRYTSDLLLWLLIISFPLIFDCIRMARYNAKPRPTDEEYNDRVNSWRPAIRQYGIQKPGLAPDEIIGQPLWVRGIIWPRFWEADYYHRHGCPVLVKQGKDGRPHASIYRFTFFYPTQHYIAVFSGDVNAPGPLRFESTRIYFYDDIVGVETTAFGMPLDTVTYTMQRFELRVSSGNSVGATTYAQDAPVDEVVQSLRVLLRDKKYGIRGGGRGLAGS